MSRQTPRKPRHTRHPSNRIPAVSDYESDNPLASGSMHGTHTGGAIQPPYDYAPPPPHRTNTDLNLSVLQRYLPSIHTILSIAANAVIYTFNPQLEGWDKSGIEGTMFVCAQSPLPDDPQRHPRACVFVLSRRGLENVVVDLASVSHVEVMDELVILKVEGGDGDAAEWDGGEEKVLGIWVHNDRADTREVSAATITESWKIARMAGVADEHVPEVGPAMQAIGSGRLTVDDLFRSQNAGKTVH